MMKKTDDDAVYNLITLNQWHALIGRASSFYPHEFFQSFTHHITERLQLKQGDKLIVCCGHSSRFIEAYALITQLQHHGFSVHVILPEPLWSGFSSHSMLRLYSPKHAFPDDAIAMIDLWLSLEPLVIGKLQSEFLAKMNACAVPKVSIEVPSGLDINTGMRLSHVLFRADLTVSSFYHKQGLWTGFASACVGHTMLIEYPLLIDAYSNVKLMHKAMMSAVMPRRAAYSHKGSFKRVVVVTGHAQMQGAALMSAKACLLMGAGSVLVIHPASDTPNKSQMDECMWQALDSGYILNDIIRPDDILVVGPGLGNDKWACEIWDVVTRLDNKTVVDASGLHHLAFHKGMHPNWIITPHPGEAGVLLACDNHSIQKDRFRACSLLQQKYGATVVLKGAGSLVYSKQSGFFVCPLGNPGMATPGMGDILSGLIAGLWAQHLSSMEAAALAVWLHAKTGDEVALCSQTGIVLASSILTKLQCGILEK